ncbi:MAG: 1-acyl-sn-glycerol-3-phosphate acyltransferase [Crocinitomicaceae bacterium]|nr:1-acyl-sn-glycerol-3-phosphate acyltransferase [Crocinitomicaceae bacterium]
MSYIKGVFYFVYKLYVMILFIVTAILLFPFLTLTTAKKPLHKIAFYLFASWSVVFRILVIWPPKVIYREKIPKRGYIIVANHSSYGDIFLSPSVLGRFPHVFLGKSEILSYPIIKYYFLNYNIPVYRGNKSKTKITMELAKQKIEEGWSIVVFPEGGIPDHERPLMLPFKDGAFRLAKETGTPILPITFVNHFQLFSDPTNWLGSCRPGFAKEVFHPIITVDEVQEKSVEELREKCFELIKGELEIYQKSQSR